MGNVKEIFKKTRPKFIFAYRKAFGTASFDFAQGEQIIPPFILSVATAKSKNAQDRQGRLRPSPTRLMILSTRRDKPLWLSIFPFPLSPAPRVRMGRIEKLHVRVFEERD